MRKALWARESHRAGRGSDGRYRAGNSIRRGLEQQFDRWPRSQEESGLLTNAHALVSALDAPEPVFALMQQRFNDFLSAEDMKLTNYFDGPTSAISGLSRRLDSFVGADSRPDAEKADVLLTQLRGMPTLVSAMRQNMLATSPDATADMNAHCAYVLDNCAH